MDQLIETFEYVRLYRNNRHRDSNVSVDPLASLARFAWRDLVIFPRYPHPPYALEQSWRLERSFQALKPR